MIIEIKNPELEALIQHRLESGRFASVEEVIADALAAQSEEEDWLKGNWTDIEEELSIRLAELDRGEGISGDVSRARLQERKAAWIAENGQK